MTDAPATVVGLLVVSYGSHELVRDNLSRTALPEGAVVVVVDNYTSDAEQQAIRDLGAEHDWHVETPAANLGFGAGMNLAAERAIAQGANVLVLLNPDAYLERDGVSRLAEQALAHPRSQISPLVNRPDGRHFSSLSEVDLVHGGVRRVRPERRFADSALWVSGACFAVSTELWRAVGGFDDDYFLYWEDVDFSVRVHDADGIVKLDDSIIAIHDPGGTQAGNGDSKSPVYYFYNARNRLVFASKHARNGDTGSWRRATVPALRELLSRGGRRHLLRPTRSVIPALRGTVEGLRFLRRDSGRRVGVRS